MITRTGKTSARASKILDFGIPMFKDSAMQKAVVYEFLISFKKLVELSRLMGVEPGKSINIGFKWGGAIKTMRTAAASRIRSEETRDDAGAPTRGLTDEREEGDWAMWNTRSQLWRR